MPNIGILVVLALFSATGMVAAESANGWCEYNVPMQKSTSTSFWQKAKKVFKKSETNMQLIRQCCVGYKLNEQKECEAVCEHECNENATCIAPNKCQCSQGYALDKLGACKAICTTVNCECAPDQCECIEGVCQVVYKGTAAEVEPISAAAGEPESPQIAAEPTVAAGSSSELQTSSNVPEEPETTTITLAYATETSDTDCHALGCHEHALCAANGSCVCQPGYTLFHATLITDVEASVSSTTEPMAMISETTTATESTTTSSSTDTITITETLCLSAADLNERLNSLAASPSDTASNGMSIGQLALLIVLACTATGLVLYLVTACTIRQRRRHQGKLDIEAKNELCCEYDNKKISEKPMVY